MVAAARRAPPSCSAPGAAAVLPLPSARRAADLGRPGHGPGSPPAKAAASPRERARASPSARPWLPLCTQLPSGAVSHFCVQTRAALERTCTCINTHVRTHTHELTVTHVLSHFKPIAHSCDSQMSTSELSTRVLTPRLTQSTSLLGLTERQASLWTLRPCPAHTLICRNTYEHTHGRVRAHSEAGPGAILVLAKG